MGCRTPALPVGSSAVKPTEGSRAFSFGVLQAYRYSDTVFSGTNDAGGGMTSTIHQSIYTLGWQAGKTWRLGIAAPYFWDLSRTEEGDDSVHLQGWGDVRLSATATPWAEQESWLGGLSFTLGLEVPTGKDDNFTANDRLGFELFEGLTTNSQTQLGSGTWDPFVGYQMEHSLSQKWSLVHGTEAQWNLGESSKGHEHGYSISARLQVAYQASSQWRISVGAEAITRDFDHVDGQRVLNTGGEVLSLSAQVAWRPSEVWSLQAGVQVPVWRDLNSSKFSPALAEEFGVTDSAQLSPGPYYYAGITFHF
jgi:hypothetical protein